MSFLDEAGELSEVPLAAVLLEALHTRASGVLTIDHGGGASRVYLRGGVPVGAQSFTAFQPLGRALLEDGVIDVDVLGRSLELMAQSGRPQGELLVELGAAQADVDRALSAQQAAYLAAVAGLARGRFRLDRTAQLPPWTDGVRVPALRAIVDALERPHAARLVFAALQPVASGPVALTGAYRAQAPAFAWTEAEAAFVERMAGLSTLDALLDRPGVPPERARAIVAALLLLELAAGRGARAPDTAEVPGIVVELEELGGTPARGVPAPAPEERVTVQARAPDRVTARMDRPARRSDPEEARQRRQRLLHRAMQNLGVGPLSGAPRPPPEERVTVVGARPPGAGAVPPRAQTPAPTPAEAELRRQLLAAAPQARSEDLFERLGLPPTAGRGEVKAAYLRLAKAFHPDRFRSPALADLADAVRDLFSSVNEAYATLSDDRKRAEHASRAAARGRKRDP